MKLEPANRSVEVDSRKTTKLVLEFDRPMSKRGFSFCGGGPQFPKFKKRPKWITKKKLVVEVELLSAGTVEWSGRLGPITAGGTSGAIIREVRVFRGPLDNLEVDSVTITEA